jgi:hypothetical protein
MTKFEMFPLAFLTLAVWGIYLIGKFVRGLSSVGTELTLCTIKIPLFSLSGNPEYSIKITEKIRAEYRKRTFTQHYR